MDKDEETKYTAAANEHHNYQRSGCDLIRHVKSFRNPNIEQSF